MGKVKGIIFWIFLAVCMFLPDWQTETEAAKPVRISGVSRDSQISEKIWWKDIAGSSNDIYYQVQYAKSKKGSYKTAGVTVNPTYDFTKYFTGTTKVLYVRVRAYKVENNGQKSYGNFSEVKEIVKSPKTTVTGIKQSKQTRNSITLKWNRTSGANGYYIQYARCWDGAGTKVAGMKKVDIGNRTSYTLKNLDNSYVYKIKLIPYYKSGTGVFGVGAASESKIMKLVPDQPDKMEKIFSVLEDVSYVDGYQVQIYNMSSKSIVYDKELAEVSAILPTLTKNVFYKGRIRAYVTVNGKKTYGQWSYYQYSAWMDFVPPKTEENKTTLKWSKVRGADGYFVYYNRDGKSGRTKVTDTVVTYKAATKNFSAYVVPYVKVGKTAQEGIVYYE